MPRQLTEEEKALFEAVLRLETPEEAAEAVMRVSLQELCEVASTVRLDTVYFLRGSLAKRKEKGSDEE